jgi:hypothetical protein
LTVTSSASSPCDFAGVVDPAAGLVSAAGSAAGRVLVAPWPDPDDEAGCDEDCVDDEDRVVAVADAPFVPPALPFEDVEDEDGVEDAVLVLPLPDRAPDGSPDDEDPVADGSPEGVDAAASEAPVEDEEFAPAVFSPSAGA